MRDPRASLSRRRCLKFAAGLGFGLLAVSSIIGETRPLPVRIDLSAGRSVPLDSWKYRDGDKAEWARPEFDDASWTAVDLQGFRRSTPGVRWYRTTLILEGQGDGIDVPAVRIVNLPMAAELYWDGENLGANGRVGAGKTDERAGRVIWQVRIPAPKSGAGAHVLALRASNWSGRSRSLMFGLTWGRASVLENLTRSSNDAQLLYMGIFLTAGLFCLALYIGTDRHRSYLIFFIYTLFHFLSAAVSYAVDTAALTFPVYHLLWPVDLGWAYVNGLFLNLFFLFHFEISRKLFHIAAMSALLAALALFGVTASGNAFTNLAMSLYAAGLLVSALRRRRPGSAAALSGLLLMLSIKIYTAVFIWAGYPSWPSPKFLFSVGRGGFLVCVILAISMAIRARSRRFEALRLKSQRLENELLKKSIQPHFIMNTLQSIKSWYGRDAGQAEQLIESLAEEYRIINRVSGESEIPLDEEIRLCRHHLQLMGLRRGARYDFHVEGGIEGVGIPPLILHTLIENGLTHAFEPGEDGSFRLEVGADDRRREFRLTNGGSRLFRPEGERPAEPAGEGMGLKYVKARLEESRPGRWSLTSGPRDGLWEVRITLSGK